MAARDGARLLMLTSLASATAFAVLAPQQSALLHLRQRGARMQEDGSDLRDAFANQLKKQKQDDRKKLKGLGAPTKPDVEGLPIRLGGTTRDGSLGDLRASWQTLLSLDIKQWQQEEYGIVGVLVLSVVSVILGFNYAFAPVPDIGSNAPGGIERASGAALDAMDEKQRKLEACLADAYGGSEQRMCNIKYKLF
eukprot:CAMPEP_0174736720 /NCGR_PEP_ID=MMETSP1094-20130205/67163_1 /TAXON_ID=156173 /ORGANISM="Chrysochromulina brevifilum, Strain UTEX LB 985" /LENGTH=193 /DNA_ID=CAMNT_0015939867 /DNA_START=62 /DNA_END=643 /DNA_ORIENTATION=+